MSEPTISFVCYTKGAVMYVTTPQWETQFLNWMNKEGRSSEGFSRSTCSQVAIKCAPAQLHAVEKKNATILRLVERDAE